MENEQFDYEAFKKKAIERLKKGGRVSGTDSIFQPLLKQFLEEAMQGELDAHMSDSERENGNRKNGQGTKKVKSSAGEFSLDTPRDRLGTYDPKLVPKRQVIITDELEEKIIRLYGKGMSTRDIADHIEELYGFSLSPTALSQITDRVLPLLKEWQERPLEQTYSFVWLDAMFFKVRSEGQVVSKALYNVIGVNNKGVKDYLGMYICESEGARFWMQVMDDLKRRGVEDILIASIDNLKGFTQAIEHVFPQTRVQLCIVHQLRNSMKYVNSKDVRTFIKELRTVYAASTETIALECLQLMEDKWGKKYPAVFRSWRDNWANLATFFNYPAAIRKVMYTTNLIEGFHRQVRKVTKTKGAFVSDMALLKLVYMASQNIVEKWKMAIKDWGEIASGLYICFGERARIELNRNSIRN
jgi:putative transposase